jgi:hypothetical protein
MEENNRIGALEDAFGTLGENPAFVKAISSVFHKDIFGRQIDSYNVDALAFLAAGIASSQYVNRYMPSAHRANNARDLLSFASRDLISGGIIMEFGVFTGGTIDHISQLRPEMKVYGFDSFQGLPESWRSGYEKGAFSLTELPTVRENVELVVGWFDRTLPIFLDAHPDEHVAMLHIDCDLYSSTQIVLRHLKTKIVPGTIIVFDEYYNYPGWELHEFRAFQEYVQANRVHYDYIGLVPGHQQVAVRIIG